MVKDCSASCLDARMTLSSHGGPPPWLSSFLPAACALPPRSYEDGRLCGLSEHCQSPRPATFQDFAASCCFRQRHSVVLPTLRRRAASARLPPHSAMVVAKITSFVSARLLHSLKACAYEGADCFASLIADMFRPFFCESAYTGLG